MKKMTIAEKTAQEFKTLRRKVDREDEINGAYTVDAKLYAEMLKDYMLMARHGVISKREYAIRRGWIESQIIG